MRIFKLVLESWPTPDGRPFADQDEALWEQAVAHWSDGNSDAVWPSWLPAGLDFTDRVPTDESFGGIQSTPGYWVGGSHLILIVPAAPTRVHYFSKSAAVSRLSLLREWGVVGHVETSNVVLFPEVAAS